MKRHEPATKGRAAQSLYREPPAVCELFGEVRGLDTPAPEAVGNSENEVVGPHVGLERAAAVEVRVVAEKAELIVAEQRDARSEVIFEADQAFNRNAGDLLGVDPRP